MTRTGALIYNTAFHSSTLRGAIANNFYIESLVRHQTQDGNSQ